MKTNATLTIIIPVYNEERTIQAVLEQVTGATLNYPLDREIIVVNDASRDKTASLVEAYIQSHPGQGIRLVHHARNAGKGASIHTGIQEATGDFVLVQDADLEYDPRDYNRLLQPLMEDRADVVYGSRFAGGEPHRILFFWHSIGNKFLTFLSNMFTNLNLTDMESGYKVFRREVIQSVQLEEKRFGFEPEVTARVARIPGIRIYEVGISYYGRTYAEGKKINWRDGVHAIYAILKYNLFARKSPDRSEALGKEKNGPAYLLLALFFLAGLALIFTAGGTADEGDSVMHYLYARHAFDLPAHFFNHWAKPLFVLLAAPFAQLGIEGMKFFNLLAATGALFYTYLSARVLNIPNAWVAPLCAAFAPMLLIVTLSGLTEPLFAFWMIGGLYWLLKDKVTLGVAWLSFLPFVRSEGLIVLSVVGVYLLFRKLYKQVPLLAVGHLVYAVAGYWVHKDLLWVFNTMTYATLSSAYGQGGWLHFVRRLPEVIGWVLCLFLVLGLVYGAIAFLRRFVFGQRDDREEKELLLVYGLFTVYFIGHTAFWALGIFNSFGLLRVMVGVLPLMGIICARGVNLVALPFLTAMNTRIVLYACLAAIALYPFSRTEHAFSWKRDFVLKADQGAEDRLGAYVKQHYPDYRNYSFYYEPAYVSVALDLNYFDTAQHKRLLNSFEAGTFRSGDFVVWDDWYAPVEGKVELAQLLQDGRFTHLQTFEEKDYWNNTRTVKLFRVK